MSAAIAFDAAWIFAAFLAIVVLAAAGLAIRRILLERRGGTVECGLRRPPGGTWRLGVAAYEADELRWYDTVGVLLTPEEVLERRTLSVASRREANPAETALLRPGMVVVTCRAGEEPETVELAMGVPALTGFLAWLEAAPPGSYPLGLLPGLEVAAVAAAGDGNPGFPSPPGYPKRSPPGFHRTSPRPALALRARMNSRSDSRFR
jgi:Protein of unknown function (DUF2550)